MNDEQMIARLRVKITQAVNSRDTVKAENARLRLALAKIADVDFYEGEWPQKVAREALGR